MDRDLLIYAGIGLLVVLAGVFVLLHLRAMRAGRPGGPLLAAACALALAAVAVPVALLATGTELSEKESDEDEASGQSVGGVESGGNQSGGNQSGGAGKPGGPAEAAAGVASSGGKDPAGGDSWFVGRWSRTPDCARSLEFRGDGTFVSASGDPGTWRVETVGGSEILDMRAGQESGRVRVERVGGGEMRLTPTDDSGEELVVTRC